MPGSGDDRVARLLAQNLACRRRLGLPVVRGDAKDLARLLAKLGLDAPPAKAPARQAPRRQAPGSQASQRPAPAPPRAARPLAPPPPRAAQPAPKPAQDDVRPPDPEREAALAQARARMGECTKCSLHEGRSKIVYGDGSASARLLIVGEGPGAQEDRQGRPFVGPAGQLLDRMLAAVGLKRDQVYIGNLVKCRPPQNREPRPEETAACRQFLEEQVRIIGPELVLALGRPAAQELTGKKAPISALRGNWHQFMGMPLMATFHPAYLLRSPEQKGRAYEDLKKLVRALRHGVIEVAP